MRVRGFFMLLAVAGFAWVPAASIAAGSDDAEFVKTAASGGMMEVELGRHAVSHAASAEVRSFGERMVADHGKANQELKAVAQKSQLVVPAQMNEKHQAQYMELSKLTGAEFDEAYMKAMLKDHEKDIDAFREQAEQGQSDVDRWAAKTLPTLEAHHALAEKVKEGAMKHDAGHDPSDPRANTRAGS
jgi:putative membrane protein